MELLSIIIFGILMVCAMKDLHKTIIVFTPFSIIFQPYFCIRYASPAISLMFAAQFALFFVSTIISKKRIDWNGFPLKKAFKWVVGVYVVGLIVSKAGIMSNLPSFFSVMLSYAFVVLYYTELKTVEDVKLSFRGFSCALAIMLIYFIYEVVNQSNPFAHYLWNILPIEKEWIYYSEEIRFGGIRCQSLMSICISWGALCCLALCAYVHTNYYRNKNAIKILIYSLLLIGVVCSGSRSAYVFAFVLLVGAIISYHGKYRTLLILLSVALFISLAGVILGSVDVLFDEDMSGSNFIQRQSQFDAAYDIVTTSPIWGFGMKGLEMVKKHSGAEVLGAESVWLQQLIYFGLLGIVQQFIMYYSCFKMVKGCKILMFLVCGWVAFSTMSSSPGLTEQYFVTLLLLLYKYNKIQNETIQ